MESEIVELGTWNFEQVSQHGRAGQQGPSVPDQFPSQKAQRERLVGLARSGTFSFLGILGAKKKISDFRNKDCNDCDSAEEVSVHPSRTSGRTEERLKSMEIFRSC
jgi:hypothetical protein